LAGVTVLIIPSILIDRYIEIYNRYDLVGSDHNSLEYAVNLAVHKIEFVLQTGYFPLYKAIPLL